jgi:hypothetical protein
MRRCPFASLQAPCIPTTIRSPRIARTFLPELKDLFVQVLLLAQEVGVLKLGTISLDGTKVHADASKRNAVRDIRLLEVETQLRTEVEELFALSEQSDQPEVPDGLVVREEIARRQERLARLAEAKAVLEARAAERAAAEQAEYEAKLAERAERERTTGRRPGGRPPTPPVPGPRDGDQYNFTDPESRIMKNPTNAGYAQDYNAQVAVDQQSLLIVGCTLSNHPNDSQEAEPTLAAIPSEIGTPEAAALDAGYFGPATLTACAKRGIEPYIATGRDPHHPSWQERFAPLPDPPPEDASAKVKMAYKREDRAGQSDLRGTQMHGRTSDRHPQRGSRLPPVLATWYTGGGGRVVSGLFGLQSQALPYLIRRVARDGGLFPVHSGSLADPVLPATTFRSGALARAVSDTHPGGAAGMTARPFSPTSC